MLKILFCKRCNSEFFILNQTYRRNKINGFCSKCVHSGANSGNRRGGKKLSIYGYVLVKNLDHPNADKNGYVQEHSLVMEKKLGRYLDKKEVIHHIDGRKDNNRRKNLQLFINDSEQKKRRHKNIDTGRFVKV